MFLGGLGWLVPPVWSPTVTSLIKLETAMQTVAYTFSSQWQSAAQPRSHPLWLTGGTLRIIPLQLLHVSLYRLPFAEAALRGSFGTASGFSWKTDLWLQLPSHQLSYGRTGLLL